jgi:peptidoglycan/xylan/chitin deacetylase (PgdA/CDA1 family)
LVYPKPARPVAANWKSIRVADSGSFSLSLAERIGLAAFLSAMPLLFLDTRWAAVPLGGFLLLCLAAPFFPRFGFYLPIVSRGTSGKKAVALTFDDGPDPLTTPHLLRLLAKYQAPAAFFVTGKKAAEHPALIKAILRQGHAIGNHSFNHSSLVLFKSCQTIARDINSAQNVLRGFGIVPLAFRPPVGITGPRLRPALLKSGVYIVNFSCRALDGGNRWIKNLSKKILKRVRPDDIILLHDGRPPKERLIPDWLNEIDRLLGSLEDLGLEILPLSEIIGKPVMIAAGEGQQDDPQLF